MPYIRKILNSETGDQEDKQMFPVLDASTNIVLDLLDLDGLDWQTHSPGPGQVMGPPNDDNIAIGHIWNGSTYIAPPLPTSILVSYAANKRWEIETGGIVIGGVSIPTDDRAKLLIKGAADSMADADTGMFVFGSTATELTGAQFHAFNLAIIAHVQACFAVQASVLDSIQAGDITTKAQIDGKNWPA